tara:strand:+ start:638 stop:1072 length:435 start_codon:yes stop_codon:yes gene_type:complete
METITKFKAIDGKEFTNKEECLKYELLIERVDSTMALLPPQPNDEGCSFSNGDGFLQHKKENLMNVKVQILEICKEYIDHNWIQQTIDDETVDPSWVARLLGDYNIRPLSNAWHRFSCVDKLHREWGQPYFANNPEKGKQVCVG